MPTYGAERAVILPQLQNASEPGWRFVENLQQNQRVAENNRRYEQARQDQMLEWALEKMDYSKVATGTVYDPSIHQTLSELQKSVADDITNGRFANNAEMMMKVASGVADVSAYSNAVKQQRARIEEELKQYEKDPSIDMNKLRKASFDMAFWKADPNTKQVSIRRPTEFENKSYVQDVLTSSPEKVVSGTQPLYESLPKQNFQEVKKTYKRRDAKGTLVDDSYSAKVFDHQEVYFDDNDHGYAKLRTRQQPLKLSDGKQVNGISDDIYDRMFGNGTNKLILNSEFNKRYKEAKSRGEINPEDEEVLKKNLALELVDASKVGKIENSDISLQKVPSSRTYNTINMPGAGGYTINDMYNRVYTKAKDMKEKGYFLRVNALTPEDQKYIVETANKLAKKNTVETDNGYKEVDFTQKDLKIELNDNGIGIYNVATNRLITYLDPTTSNVSVQPGIKEERAVLQQNRNTKGGVQSTGNKSGLKQSYSAGGKTFSLKQLRDMGYTDAQIQQAVKLGNLK
jgi:autonomous glycyl radical cofactor GrcA